MIFHVAHLSFLALSAGMFVFTVKHIHKAVRLRTGHAPV